MFMTEHFIQETIKNKNEKNKASKSSTVLPALVLFTRNKVLVLCPSTIVNSVTLGFFLDI